MRQRACSASQAVTCTMLFPTRHMVDVSGPLSAMDGAAMAAIAAFRCAGVIFSSSRVMATVAKARALARALAIENGALDDYSSKLEAT